MKVSWLFETDIFDEGVVRFSDAANDHGMEAAYVAQCRSGDVAGRFDGSYLDIYPADACVVFHGSLGFAAQVRREASWVPGVYCTPENLKCSRYFPEFGRYLLAQDYAMVPFGDLARRRDLLFGLFGLEDTLFVRPDSGSKIFTGQVIYRENWEKDLGLIAPASISPAEMVVVSSPRNIVGEWRFVVADHEVIAASSYRLDREIAREPWPLDGDAYLLAKEVASHPWQPDRLWTLDVCRTNSGHHYLVEINSFSCSGMYACDPGPIVEHASRIALEDWKGAYCDN